AAVTPLIEAYERFAKKEKDGKLESEARLALGAITGETFATPGDWRRWWEANEATFDPTKVAEKKEREGGTVIRRVHERGDGEYIERLEKADIVVVTGQKDRTQEVLDVLKLPYTVFTRDQFAAKLPTLDPR